MYFDFDRAWNMALSWSIWKRALFLSLSLYVYIYIYIYICMYMHPQLWHMRYIFRRQHLRIFKPQLHLLHEPSRCSRGRSKFNPWIIRCPGISSRASSTCYHRIPKKPTGDAPHLEGHQEILGIWNNLRKNKHLRKQWLFEDFFMSKNDMCNCIGEKKDEIHECQTRIAVSTLGILNFLAWQTSTNTSSK